MNANGGPLSAMEPPSRWGSSQQLSAADAERLVAGRGAHPEAPAVQHELAWVLDSVAGPASDSELAGELAAVAAFVLATGERGRRSARFRAHTRRGPAIAACLVTAVAVAFSGAAADVLPAPIQELAHTTFGAPAPRHAPPARQATPHGAKPGPATSPSAKKGHGAAKVPGKKMAPRKQAPGKAKARPGTRGPKRP